MAYLVERESDQATEELLAIPGFLEDLETAEEAIEAGKVTPVQELQRKY
ncbi:MAG: hypothetical protein AAF560_03605 [Acidobacteriota bacterium]